MSHIENKENNMPDEDITPTNNNSNVHVIEHDPNCTNNIQTPPPKIKKSPFRSTSKKRKHMTKSEYISNSSEKKKKKTVAGTPIQNTKKKQQQITTFVFKKK